MHPRRSGESCSNRWRVQGALTQLEEDGYIYNDIADLHMYKNQCIQILLAFAESLQSRLCMAAVFLLACRLSKLMLSRCSVRALYLYLTHGDLPAGCVLRLLSMAKRSGRLLKTRSELVQGWMKYSQRINGIWALRSTELQYFGWVHLQGLESEASGLLGCWVWWLTLARFAPRSCSKDRLVYSALSTS